MDEGGLFRSAGAQLKKISGFERGDLEAGKRLFEDTKSRLRRALEVAPEARPATSGPSSMRSTRWTR